MEKHIWSHFFEDQNIRFPEQPKLIDGISVYDAPYGLGLQFRGGPDKLVLRGKSSSALFSSLSHLLDGKNTLASIFDVTRPDFDINEVATMLKILHSYNLLADGLHYDVQATPAETDPWKLQKDYYKRVIGKTAYNKSATSVVSSIDNAKVLLIASENLAPVFVYNLKLAGFKHIGLNYIRTEGGVTLPSSESEADLMTYTDITDLNEPGLRNELAKRIDDYHYVLVGLENPSINFVQQLNEFCKIKNKKVLFVLSKDNHFEIGPYFVPNSTACYNCSILRQNSYKEDAIFDKVHSQHLHDTEQKVDTAIKGVDLVSASAAVGYAVSELSKIVSKLSKPNLINRVVDYDFLNGTIDNIHLMPVPGCPVCSN
ncbi:TOMM precursor leader peptide-binding protein [Hymenobacter crusticola]|nr:TOMM precursor leader peptide-binding protein [Hymenobacter crusticola]